MQRQEIEQYLAELGQTLEQQGVQQPVRILLIGGAYMLTQFHNRANTNDIDILLEDVDNPTAPLYQAFRTAARIVAQKHKLSMSWINDVIGDFVRDVSIIPQGTLWRRFAALEVYIPPSEYILALKLLAGRQKDSPDIGVLCQQLHIQTRSQAQQLVDRYIPDRQVQQMNDLDDTLDDIFS